MIETIKAIEICRGLENLLSPRGFHCALTGSVLYKGYSENDLDIIIYRHKSGEVIKHEDIFPLLENAGMKYLHRINVEKYGDNKEVHRLTYNDIKLDIFTSLNNSIDI